METWGMKGTACTCLCSPYPEDLESSAHGQSPGSVGRRHLGSRSGAVQGPLLTGSLQGLGLDSPEGLPCTSPLPWERRRGALGVAAASAASAERCLEGFQFVVIRTYRKNPVTVTEG